MRTYLREVANDIRYQGTFGNDVFIIIFYYKNKISYIRLFRTLVGAI